MLLNLQGKVRILTGGKARESLCLTGTDLVKLQGRWCASAAATPKPIGWFGVRLLLRHPNL